MLRSHPLKHFLDYSGRIQVDKSLLNVVLLDQLPESDSQALPSPISVAVVRKWANGFRSNRDSESIGMSRYVCRGPGAA